MRSSMKPVSTLAGDEVRVLQRTGEERRVGFHRPYLDPAAGACEGGRGILARLAHGRSAWRSSDRRTARSRRPARRRYRRGTPSGRRRWVSGPVEGRKPLSGFSAYSRASIGVAVALDRVLRQRQRFARRHAQLPFDQIEAGDRLGDRVLDLQARVHFHEPDAVGAQALRRIGDEFDRAGAHIAHGLGRLDRRAVTAARVASSMPGAGASSITFWWRRCSEQSRSNRCTTLPWVSPNTCTSIWRGRGDIFLEQHAVVAEAALRLAPGRTPDAAAKSRTRHRPCACPCRRRRRPP